MADVFAIFGILLTLGIVFPGMLAALWLLFPRIVERAQINIDQKPWRCFWSGLAFAILLGAGVGILLSLPSGALKLTGWSLLAFILGIASIGAAGIAAHMGNALITHSHGNLTPSGGFLRGAVALELAAAFPLIGWLIFIPIGIITSLGAVCPVLVRREWKTLEPTSISGRINTVSDSIPTSQP